MPCFETASKALHYLKNIRAAARDVTEKVLETSEFSIRVPFSFFIPSLFLAICIS